MPPAPRQQMAPPPIQEIIPKFPSNFKAKHPYFYFVHKIDAQKATLTVEVIGPNLTYTFTHSHALTSDRLRLSDVAWALERKTVGFLAIARNDEDRHILAWAESGHGLGRSGDLLDAPKGGPVLSSELWTRRVIRVGHILGMKMRRGFDNQNNSADPSLDIDGIFQGSHVEAKLAVHAIWVMLETFNITKDLNNVTKENLEKLKGKKWADGSKPSFEVYFSRKNCPPCGNLVKGLSDLTGIEIKLPWKDRLTKMQYYKPPKSKQQAVAQKKAFVMQRDVADFDDIVARRAEEEAGNISENSIIISDPDTPMDSDEDSAPEPIVIDDDAPRRASTAEAIDLTKDETDNSERRLSKTILERQRFMEEMKRYQFKANASPIPERSGPPRQSASRREREQLREQMRREIRKPLPATSVEVEFLPAEQWENRGSQHRRRFLQPLGSGSSTERTRSASPRRSRAGVRSRSMRRPETARLGSLENALAKASAVSAASDVGLRDLFQRPFLPLRTSETKQRSTRRHSSREVVDLSSEDSEMIFAVAPATQEQSRQANSPDNSSEAARDSTGIEEQAASATSLDKLPEIMEVDKLHDASQKSPTPDGMEVDKAADTPAKKSTPVSSTQTAKSPTRVLFPECPAPRFDLSQSTFPSPKPTENTRPKDAPKPTHHPTPQMKKSFAQNQQRTAVLHYPTPVASSTKGTGQELSPTPVAAAIMDFTNVTSANDQSKEPVIPKENIETSPKKPAYPSASIMDFTNTHVTQGQPKEPTIPKEDRKPFPSKPKPVFDYPKPPPSGLLKALAEEKERKNQQKPNLDTLIAHEVTEQRKSEPTTPTRPRLGKDL